MDKDEAYLVGYTIGDGCLYTRQRVSSLNPAKMLGCYEVTWGDKDIEQLRLIQAIVGRKFPLEWLRIKERKRSAGKILQANRKQVFKYISELLEYSNIEENSQLTAEFISGFCDAEADVGTTLNVRKGSKKYTVPRIQITQKDRKLLEKIQKLLEQHFSIESSVYKKWKQDAYVLQLKSRKRVAAFKKHISFRNLTKRSKLANLV